MYYAPLLNHVDGIAYLTKKLNKSNIFVLNSAKFSDDANQYFKTKNQV